MLGHLDTAPRSFKHWLYPIVHATSLYMITTAVISIRQLVDSNRRHVDTALVKMIKTVVLSTRKSSWSNSIRSSNTALPGPVIHVQNKMWSCHSHKNNSSTQRERVQRYHCIYLPLYNVHVTNNTSNTYTIGRANRGKMHTSF